MTLNFLFLTPYPFTYRSKRFKTDFYWTRGVEIEFNFCLKCSVCKSLTAFAIKRSASGASLERKRERERKKIISCLPGKGWSL